MIWSATLAPPRTHPGPTPDPPRTHPGPAPTYPGPTPLMRPLPLLLLLAGCVTARATTGPITTDRPDYTESASVVARPQVEAGVTRTHADRATDLSIGELLLRVPLAARVEGRVNVGSLGMASAAGARTHGFEDPELQAKIALGAGGEGRSRLVPTTALIVGSTLPLGTNGFGAHVAQPGAKLVGEWELSERVGLASNLNYAWASDGDRRFGQASVTASLGTGWTDRLGSFLEYYDFLPAAPGAGAAHYGDLGATYQLSPDFQLDARVGTRLAARRGEAAERFVGLGVARRW